MELFPRFVPHFNPEPTPFAMLISCISRSPHRDHVYFSLRFGYNIHCSEHISCHIRERKCCDGPYASGVMLGSFISCAGTEPWSSDSTSTRMELLWYIISRASLRFRCSSELSQTYFDDKRPRTDPIVCVSTNGIITGRDLTKQVSDQRVHSFFSA